VPRSWREDVSVEAQADLDGMLDACLRFAEQTLNKYGEMYPFGAAVATDGTYTMIALDPPEGTKPTEMLAMLHEAARQHAEGFRAVAFVADVLVDGKDAVQVESEHREGIAIGVVAPYKKGRFRKKDVTFGTLSAVPGTRRVWPG
jgi:hypothetical protein